MWPLKLANGNLSAKYISRFNYNSFTYYNKLLILPKSEKEIETS